MYIEPNSTIKFYKNVPLDLDFNNTLYFVSVAMQNAYFHGDSSILIGSVERNSYQRVNKGTMRVEKTADSLYGCNYLAFRNTNYDNKWFYGFVTNVEYVNNITCEVTYIIDPMQTYAFDYELRECFVEREHSETDNVGDNLLPEPLDLGEYVYTNYKPITDIRSLAVIIVISNVVPGTSVVVNGQTIDGVYSGGEMWVYDSEDSDGINAKLSEYSEKPDAILAMYMIPKFLIGNTIPTNHHLSYAFRSASISYTDPDWKLLGTESIKGHSVRNKKLYTYPYNFFNLDNANGRSLPLRYEYFNDLQPRILCEGTIRNPVSVTIRPQDYKGQSITSIADKSSLNTESITLDNYPMCSWSYDAFKSWVAQNAIPMAIGGVSTIASMAIPTTHQSSKTTKVYSGRKIAQKWTEEFQSDDADRFNGIASILSDLYTASISADITRGSQNSSNVNVTADKQTIFSSRVSVDKQHAEIIDKFFDVFGYATKCTKIPNISARPHWNYVKTNGCVIVGKNNGIPSNAISQIKSIFDSGITFWKHPNEVGDYTTFDNSPV